MLHVCISSLLSTKYFTGLHRMGWSSPKWQIVKAISSIYSRKLGRRMFFSHDVSKISEIHSIGWTLTGTFSTAIAELKSKQVKLQNNFCTTYLSKKRRMKRNGEMEYRILWHYIKGKKQVCKKQVKQCTKGL